MSDFKETKAWWGKKFVEVRNPNKKNDLIRFYFETHTPEKHWPAPDKTAYKNLTVTQMNHLILSNMENNGSFHELCRAVELAVLKGGGGHE